MSQLIQARWTTDEAQREGITVTPAAIDARLTAERKAFPSAKLWQDYLKRTRLSTADLRDRARLELVQQQLYAKRISGARTASEAQVAAYFTQNIQRFALPERRDLQLILTGTPAKAAQAQKAIETGVPWAAAVTRFSSDPITRAAGGAMLSVLKGGLTPLVDAAVFSAHIGVLIGPLHDLRGWYLIRVTRIQAATKPQLAQFRDRIRLLLTAQTTSAEASAGAQALSRHWRALTLCRSGYVVPLCANG
jgi:parvulin-like peptidyl-prolyl isomerase